MHRCQQRSGLSQAQALARIQSQLSQEEKIKYANEVIDTDRSLSEVEAGVKELWERLRRK